MRPSKQLADANRVTERASPGIAGSRSTSLGVGMAAALAVLGGIAVLLTGISVVPYGVVAGLFTGLAAAVA